MLPPPVPRRSGPSPGPAPSSGGARATNPDDYVRSTDDDAAQSRQSAVSLGYLVDPYAALLHKTKLGGGPVRKAPLINIGTHHRTAALDAVVDSFLARAGPDAQVVSLGAGSDTRFWRLMARSPPPRIRKYVEIDFAQLTGTKAQRIARSAKLSSALGIAAAGGTTAAAPTAVGSMAPPPVPGSMPPPPAPSKPYTVSRGGTALASEAYALLPLDLRDRAALDADLAPLLDASKPTLLIAECVFCYLPPADSHAVIEWFGARFPRSAAVLYEMCGLDDAFGRVMKRNLAARNLSLPGAVFASPQAQAERFTDGKLGKGAFERAGGKSLWEIRTDVIPAEELARISKLEILDEIEELRLVLSHYCVAWGSKGEGMEGIGLESRGTA